MSFSSKAFALAIALAALLFSEAAFALEIGAFYYASCQRHLGVILGVDAQNIQIATIEGAVVSLPRYQIIYWSNYPVEDLPIQLSETIAAIPALKIYTRQDYQKVLLAEGWPIDFTDDRVAFLTPQGKKLVIEIDNIWEIERREGSALAEAVDGQSLRSLNFAHPPVFRDCPSPKDARKTAYPEQTLVDPISIKRELDRLQKGHLRLEKFQTRQHFYAIPQLYRNRTYLGLWHMFGARYGSNARRPNNLTPLLVDQTSKEPFGFQQYISTGSAPLPQLPHEETQLSIFYRFKADYFHFSGMIDPMLAFIGQKYRWLIGDMASGEARFAPQYFAEFGVDIGHFSLELFPAMGLELGARVGGTFTRKDFSMPQVGLAFQNQRAKVEALAGQANVSGFKISVMRLNLSWEFSPKLDAGSSLILRDIDITQRAPPTNLLLSAHSVTTSAFANYVFARKYYTGIFLSRESESRRAGFTSLNQQLEGTYWKGGMSFALGF